MITAVIVKFWRWWKSDRDVAPMGWFILIIAGLMVGLKFLDDPAGFIRVMRWWWAVVLYGCFDYLVYVRNRRLAARSKAGRY